MLAATSFPGVLCGHIVDVEDAYMFAQINDGNAIAMPFAKGFGWGASCTYSMYLRSFSAARAAAAIQRSA